MGQQCDRQIAKIKELEFHINILMNDSTKFKSQYQALDQETILLKKHNAFLHARTTESKHFPKSVKPTYVIEKSQAIDTEMFEKHHALYESFRRKTLELTEKCKRMMNHDQASIAAEKLQAELVSSYIDHERDLISHIKSLKSGTALNFEAGVQDSLRKELKEFMAGSQARLEKEKYALLARCSALEQIEDLDLY